MPEVTNGISRQSLQNKLRDIGFSFDDEAKVTYVWRRGQELVFVPKRSFLPAEHAARLLLKAGCPLSEVEAFLQAARA